MTLEEANKQLPNGFHDAEVERFSFEPTVETLLLELDLWVGTMDDPPSLRERYRRGRICFSGVDFFSMGPPRAKPLDWIVRALEQEPYTRFETIYPAQQARELRLSQYKLWLGYDELTVAAEAFDFDWTTEQETNRSPSEKDDEK